MNRKGFTLLELLIVVIIIGSLVAIALPQYIKTIEVARSVEAVINIGSLRVAIERYWYERGGITTDLDTLDVSDPNEQTERLFHYTITDDGTTSETRKFTVRAERIGMTSTYWVKWVQINNNTGKLYKSNTLGGPES